MCVEFCDRTLNLRLRRQKSLRKKHCVSISLVTRKTVEVMMMDEVVDVDDANGDCDHDDGKTDQNNGAVADLARITDTVSNCLVVRTQRRYQ